MIEGKYIAIAAIWFGVAVSSFRAKQATPAIAFFAMIATFILVSK